MERGKRTDLTTCFACHQPEGQGLADQFPPLAKSDYLMADKDRAIRSVLRGLSGPIVVNGKPFNNSMPELPFNDDEVADVLTFVMNSFGNPGGEVTAEQVRRVRAELK
jgi:nitrite reductase (NO-forming)